MEDQVSKFRWVVLILLYVNIFIVILAGISTPPLFPEIARDIPMSKSQMGLIMGMYTLAGLFFAPLGGSFADKLGSRWVFGGAAVLISLGGGLRYFIGSPIQMMICMFFIGAGLTIFMTLLPKILSIWFGPKELATVNGICSTSVTVGGALAMATAAKFMSPLFNGWRGTAFALGCLSLAMGIAWVIIYREPQKDTDHQSPKEDIRINFKKVLKIKDVWLFALNYFFVLAAVMSIVSLLPVALQEKGIDNAGELVAIFMAMTCVFKIVGGITSDKVGKRKLFLIFCGIAFALSIPPFMIFQEVPLIIALCIAGIAAGPLAPILMTALVEIDGIGSSLAGTAFGLVNMIATLGGFLGPAIAGYIMDQFGTPVPGFIFTAVLSLMAGLVIIPAKIR